MAMPDLTDAQLDAVLDRLWKTDAWFLSYNQLGKVTAAKRSEGREALRAALGPLLEEVEASRSGIRREIWEGEL